MTHDQDTTPIAIYALCDPDTGEVRYIGQTRDPAGRLRAHIGCARYGPRIHAAWIEALRAHGRAPLMRVLETVSAEHADAVERSQIAAHRARGCQLTNAAHNFEQNPRPPGRVAPELRWRTMLRLSADDGAEIDRIATREATPSATVCRRLLLERLEQLQRERAQARSA